MDLLFFVFWLLPVFSGAAEELILIKSRSGELVRGSEPGTPVFFDAPLRANRRNSGPISIHISDEAASQAFGVFPTVVQPGEGFTLILRDSSLIPIMDEDNVFQVPLNATYLDVEGAAGEDFSVYVKLTRPETEIPRLSKPEQVFKLNQRLTEGIVGKIGVTNLDKTDLDEFEYQLFGGFTELFTIQTAKEGLFLLTRGCQPEICLKIPANFTILLRIVPVHGAHMAVSPPEITLLHFQISRQNMMGPRFLDREYSASIRENSAKFVDSVLLQAEGPDARAGQEASMIFTLAEPSDVFDLDAVHGTLSVKNSSLITVQHLGHTVQLMAQVSDGKNPMDSAAINVKILSDAVGVDDNPVQVENFEFQQPIYAFALAPKQKKVGKIGLLDGQEAVFKIAEGGMGNFLLDENSGDIEYIGPVERNAKNYTLKVIALPKIKSSTVAVSTVHILIAGIGSHLPKFESSFEALFVDADAVPDTVITKLAAADADKDASLVFRTESAVCRDFLSQTVECGDEIVLHPNGEVVVTKIGPELMTTLMNVSVTDKSHRLEDKDYEQILVTIKRQKRDVIPENIFKFEDTVEPLIVADDLPVGSYVYTALLNPVKNDDFEALNPVFEFSLDPEVKSFRIDKKTGMIYTSESLKQAGFLNVTVTADVTFNGTRTLHLATVIPVESVKMDVDLPFVENLDTIHLQIDENVAPGTRVGVLGVKESDGGKNMFEIRGNAEAKKMFRIENGVVTVAPGAVVDFEVVKKLNFFVRITNEMEKSVVLPVSITVNNLNDNTPYFVIQNNTQIFAFENSPLESFVGRVYAVDDDGDTLSYHLQYPVDSLIKNKLSISRNGVIETAQILTKLDGIYPVTVIARDGISGATVKIEVVVVPTSKCQPIFDENQQVVFKIDDSTKIGAVFGSLKADFEENMECPEILYTVDILTEYGKNVVTVAKNGDLELAQKIDNLVGKRIPVVVSAASGNLLARKAGEIRVGTVKTQKPVFTARHVRVEVDENKMGTIFIARATSKNKNVYYRLEDDFSGLFNIETETGILNLTRPFDREIEDFYTLKIQTSTNDKFVDEETDEMRLNVIVNDVDDNYPTFNRDLYELGVESTTIAGTTLLTTRAEDLDATAQNRIVYSLNSNTFKQNGRTNKIDDVFRVENDTGKVVLLKSLTDFEGGVFELNITADNSASVKVPPESPQEFIHSKTVQKSMTTVKIWVASPTAHVLPLLLHQNPIQLSQTQLRHYNDKLSTYLKLPTLLLSLKYYSMQIDDDSQMPIRDATIGRFIALDPSQHKLIPFKTLKKQLETMDVEGLSMYTGYTLEKSRLDDSTTSESSLLVLGLIFGALLLFTFTILGILVCYYRKKFEKERQGIIGARITAATMNRPPFRNWSPYITRPPELLWERSTTATTGSTTPERRSSYSVQEMKIAVFS